MSVHGQFYIRDFACGLVEHPPRVFMVCQCLSRGIVVEGSGCQQQRK